jgi:putative PIN family toxin of toxin-antitoxin system
MRIVLDTNVLVSGLHNPHGTPGRIVDLMLGGKVKVLYDDRILSEYLDVLLRPSLAIEPEQARAVVEYIRLSGERIAAIPLPSNALPDPDDLAFAEVAITGQADMLVTGNARHFTGLEERRVPVFSPAGFLEQFIEQSK